ncbi:unnamed protein product [Effrenium voratum]|uniref:Uncharacterized protein n=1 Tax=Effrenium voratum TaxID=2562239 RepID=A0AA36NBV7_9DINO|nr:unnamed protein product [Effrenium voratum]
MALHSVLSLGIGVGSASAASHKSVEEGHAPKSQPEGPAAPPSLFDTLLGPDTQDDEVFIEEYAGPVELTIHSLADTMTELEVSCDAEIEDVKNRAAQRLVRGLSHWRWLRRFGLKTSSLQVLPGNGTVKSCQLSHRSRLLLMGKSRLYAPKDVHVSAMLVYARLAEKKFVLAKPQTLRENEDLLLRLDTEEYEGTLNSVPIPGGALGRFKTLPVGSKADKPDRQQVAKDQVREIFIPLSRVRRYLTG